MVWTVCWGRVMDICLDHGTLEGQCFQEACSHVSGHISGHPWMDVFWLCEITCAGSTQNVHTCP